ncbi:MAG: serine/threonine-protein phosphatase [Anaerolineales bacterium]|nr:serine/threonine-protein phosphatase [Anaerolineales bacterium]
MELQIAVSKVRKYATSSSGDTVEVVERPNGGLSIVMADGQSSGRGAKWISTMVVRKVISLLAEGVRDGAAARAASDSLFTERKGKVSSTLNILSVDMRTQSLVITRNNPAPVLLVCNDVLNELNEHSLPVGLYRDTRPQIFETKLSVGLTAVAYTDGLVHAGSRNSISLDMPQVLMELIQTPDQSAQVIADSLLARAMELDQGRPVDDTSIAVLRVLEKVSDGARRMVVHIPLEPIYSLF